MIVNPHDGQAVSSKKYTIQPLGDRLLVRKIKQTDAEMVNGVFIPVGKEVQYLALVIAVGPGVLKVDGSREPLTCKPGDTVMLMQYVPEITLNGVRGYMVMTQEMLVGIVREVLDVPEYEAPEREISFQEAYERRQSLVKPS